MSDKIIRFLAYDGKISIVCSDTTELVEEARKTHDLSPLATAAFGRLATITAIMAQEMKNSSDKITVQIKGNGEIGTMLTTANNFPKVKGFVSNPHVDLPLNEFGKLDVSGELADDFTNYFLNSEQRQSAVALGVLVNKDGVKAAGGYLINPMPDATAEEIYKVEQSIFKAGAISKMLDENLSLLEIAKKVTGDNNVKVVQDNIVPVYECDCSKESMADGLASIGKTELEDIIEKEGKAELVCHFCNKKYQFSKEELKNIINNI